MQTTPNNTFATVTSASSQALPGNGARSMLHLTNDSNNNIYISFGKSAVVGSGILLTPGGSRDFSQFANSSPIWLGPVFAIASTGSNNLAIMEEYN